MYYFQSAFQYASISYTFEEITDSDARIVTLHLLGRTYLIYGFLCMLIITYLQEILNLKLYDEMRKINSYLSTQRNDSTFTL